MRFLSVTFAEPVILQQIQILLVVKIIGHNRDIPELKTWIVYIYHLSSHERILVRKGWSTPTEHSAFVQADAKNLRNSTVVPCSEWTVLSYFKEYILGTIATCYEHSEHIVKYFNELFTV